MDWLLSADDWQAIALTLKLAALVTVLLLLLGTPLAWWLARTRSVFRGPVSALVALPLVLPPTVLGFYLLLAMGPNGPVGGGHSGAGHWLVTLYLFRPLGGGFAAVFSALCGATHSERHRSHGRAPSGRPLPHSAPGHWTAFLPWCCRRLSRAS